MKAVNYSFLPGLCPITKLSSDNCWSFLLFVIFSFFLIYYQSPYIFPKLLLYSFHLVLRLWNQKRETGTHRALAFFKWPWLVFVFLEIKHRTPNLDESSGYDRANLGASEKNQISTLWDSIIILHLPLFACLPKFLS